MLIAMTVLAVLAALLAPNVRGWPDLFAIGVVSVFLGYLFSKLWCLYLVRRTNNKVMRKAGELLEEILMVEMKHRRILLQFGTFIIPMFMGSVVVWLTFIAPQTVGHFRWYYQAFGVGVPSYWLGIAMAGLGGMRTVSRFAPKLALHRTGVVKSPFANMTWAALRLYHWKSLRVIFLRNGNARLRLDYYPSFPLIAEVPAVHSERLREVLIEQDIPFDSDEVPPHPAARNVRKHVASA